MCGVGAVKLVAGSGGARRLGRVERALGLLRWVGGLGRVCLGGGCVGGRAEARALESCRPGAGAACAGLAAVLSA